MSVKKMQVQVALEEADEVMRKAHDQVAEMIEKIVDKLEAPCPKCKRLQPCLDSGYNRNYGIHYLNFRCGKCGAFNVNSEEGPHPVSDF